MFAGAMAATLLVAAVVIISRAPVAERQGTAPSVVTNSAGAEAQSLRGVGPAPDPRQVDAGSNSGRAARGSGVEGVNSGGVTTEPPRRQTLLTRASTMQMHTPEPQPPAPGDEPDVKPPPVPPDQEPDVVPQRDPPKPGQNVPLIAMTKRALMLRAK